jgi:hypothetical protein
MVRAARQETPAEEVNMSHRSSAATDPRARLTPTKIAVSVILLATIVVPLLVSTYDQRDPELFGFPFFYWYQLIWVFICAALCGLSFWLLKRERDAYRAQHGEVGE